MRACQQAHGVHRVMLCGSEGEADVCEGWEHVGVKKGRGREALEKYVSDNAAECIMTSRQ